MSTPKLVAGRLEEATEILHLWFPNPVLLRDSQSVTAFFDEVIEDWIDKAPAGIYLLVNYENLHIAAQVADSYAANIKRFQHKLRGTFRYGVPGDFTGVAVSLGNMKLQAQANLFPDEATARAAIEQLRARIANTGVHQTFATRSASICQTFGNLDNPRTAPANCVPLE